MGKTWLKWLYNFKLTFIKKSLGPNFLAANLRILVITCDSLCPHDDWTSRGHHVPTGCHRTEEDFFSSCVSFYKWGEPFPEAPSSLPTSWNQIACLSKPADGKRKNTTTGLWPIRIQPGGLGRRSLPRAYDCATRTVPARKDWVWEFYQGDCTGEKDIIRISRHSWILVLSWP